MIIVSASILPLHRYQPWQAGFPVDCYGPNDDHGLGIPQCIAELIACRIVNERQGRSIAALYGCVTTGTVWKYLKYSDNTVVVDLDDYYIREVDKILGIFKFLIEHCGT